MDSKIKVGVLGATGMVGQRYITLLENHPWFEVSYLAASPQSAGKKYSDAVLGRWQMEKNIPESIRNLVVQDVGDLSSAKENCDFVFSAFEMSDKDLIRKYEEKYADNDLPVVSNASAHRHTEDVPMLVPEINHEHVKMIDIQRKNRGWDKGLIAVKPNCSLQSYIMPIYALIKAGFEIESLILTTMQAISGSGYPGVASLDVTDNLLPFIGGEEEKSEIEPLKILGDIQNGKVVNYDRIKISAHCNRVAVVDGHTACVSLKFRNEKPSKEKILEIWNNFKELPQELDLPFAPAQPIIYKEEDNRPQPRKDRDNDKGMAATIGRLRDCNVFDYRFTSLSHNTIRGAAGGGILNAELLVKKGYIN